MNPVSPLTVPTAAAVSGDDWTTFAHDFRRTGYQAQNTGISASSVGSLKLRWTYKVAEGEVASPLVSKGVVFLASTGGIIRALSAQTGTMLWQRAMGGTILMTPTIADGMLFVGTHGVPSVFAALDVKTGVPKWQITLPGPIRSEPVVANGMVFEGISGGDPPACLRGGVDALDENSGAIRWSWYVAPTAGDGGSVWSPISFDGAHLFFGTGNTCNDSLNTGDAEISLGLDGSLVWDASFVNSRSDDDIGGGTLISDNQAIFTSKNGFIYDVNTVTGATNWHQLLTAVDGYGGIGTPTTNGEVVLASAGYLSDPTRVAVPGGRLVATSDGQTRWAISTSYAIPGYAAIANGIAFADLDNALTAIDPASGRVLWSYVAGSLFYASPVIVPSGVYCVDSAGDAYAFSL